jgi:hypothetical protein
MPNISCTSQQTDEQLNPLSRGAVPLVEGELSQLLLSPTHTYIPGYVFINKKYKFSAKIE